MAPPRWQRRSVLLLLAAAVVFLAQVPAARGQAPACATDLSGSYFKSYYGEWALYQSGCNLIVSEWFDSTTTATVSGDKVTFNYTGRGGLDGLVGYWNPDTKVMSLSDGSTLTKTGNCSKWFVGYWVDGSNGSLAISMDAGRCTGTMFRSPGGYSVAVTMSGHVMTYKPSPTAVTNVTAVLTLPAILTFSDGSVWNVGGPTPCLRKSDFRLSTYCWLDLQGLQTSGGFGSISQANAGREPVWNLNTGYCDASGHAQSECPANCTWFSGACTCPDEATCVAGGFAWESKALFRGVCVGNIPAMLTQPTANCCGGAPNMCQAIGTAPPSPPPPSPSLAPIPSPAYSTPTPGPSYWPPTPVPTYYPPAPGPAYHPPAPGPAYYPPTPGCGKLPSTVIHNVEQVSGLVVRRCGSSPPSPTYAPSPGYLAPAPQPPPYYAPSPGYWVPTMSPPSPSPSYPKAGPSPSWR